MNKFPTVLVGNGKSLLDSPRGDLINSHKTVVRFNTFSLSKPEFTGLKISVWAINKNMLIEGVKGLTSASIMAVVHASRNDHPWCSFEQKAFKLGFDYLPLKTVREAYSFFGKWQPTTGALALGYYAARGGCALIAFDRLKDGEIHWFNKVRHKPELHSPDLEQKWIQVHVKAGNAIVV